MIEPIPTSGADVPAESPRTSTPGALPTEAAALGGLLDRRHSCRAFRDQPLPPETITTLLHLAQRTASWCNSQAWRVAVTSGPATERLGEALTDAACSRPTQSDVPPPSEYRGVYRERRRKSGFGLYSSLGIERDDHEARQRQMLENFRFFGAPHVAVITSDAALGPYGLVDCGAYVSTFLTAATSLGIATIAQAAIAMYSDVVHDQLAIGADRLVVCAVSFGHADENHPANSFRTERADLAEVVDWHEE